MTLAEGGAHRRTMTWPRTRHRIAAIDAYRFPAAVRQRLASEHEGLTRSDLDQVESATRQWFRLAARHPRARLTMPSMIAAALWSELSRQTTDYTAFCAEAFGRAFPYATEPGALADTYRLARQDENGPPTTLPLLFRVDQLLAIPGGHRYLADCGGRGTCYDVPGVLCLHHLKGPGRAVRGRKPFGPPPPGYSDPGGGGLSCGAGCGSS